MRGEEWQGLVFNKVKWTEARNALPGSEYDKASKMFKTNHKMKLVIFPQNFTLPKNKKMCVKSYTEPKFKLKLQICHSCTFIDSDWLDTSLK